jgi:hypothetical protein
MHAATPPVKRIMRRALPSHAKIANDTVVLMQQCTSEFILFFTSEGERIVPPLREDRTLTAFSCRELH